MSAKRSRDQVEEPQEPIESPKKQDLKKSEPKLVNEPVVCDLETLAALCANLSNKTLTIRGQVCKKDSAMGKRFVDENTYYLHALVVALKSTHPFVLVHWAQDDIQWNSSLGGAAYNARIHRLLTLEEVSKVLDLMREWNHRLDTVWAHDPKDGETLPPLICEEEFKQSTFDGPETFVLPAHRAYETTKMRHNRYFVPYIAGYPPAPVFIPDPPCVNDVEPVCETNPQPEDDPQPEDESTVVDVPSPKFEFDFPATDDTFPFAESENWSFVFALEDLGVPSKRAFNSAYVYNAFKYATQSSSHLENNE